MNTNIDGRRKVPYALTSIKGVGRRFAYVCLRKADVDPNKRAGELSEEEVTKILIFSENLFFSKWFSNPKVDRVMSIVANPRHYKIPDWFLNRQKDIKDGKYSQVTSNMLDNKFREDLERLKKIRAHRGLRHYWG